MKFYAFFCIEIKILRNLAENEVINKDQIQENLNSWPSLSVPLKALSPKP